MSATYARAAAGLLASKLRRGLLSPADPLAMALIVAQAELDLIAQGRLLGQAPVHEKETA